MGNKLTEFAEELIANGWAQIQLQYWPGDEDSASAWKCFGVWDDGASHIRIWASDRTPLEAMNKFRLQAKAISGATSAKAGP